MHFYDEVSTEELFVICRDRLADIERVQEELLAWVADHPELVDAD